jgi:type VI secretion system protein ImpA
MDLSVLKKLYEPCSEDSPTGPNLEYDHRFLTMLRMSESQPELQYGSTIVPARSPEWARLLESCIEVSEQTRDLRVAVLIVESLCQTNQWAGLATGLELTASWLTKWWDSLHPQLDSEDDFDPTARLSILSSLVSEERLLQTVSRMPVFEHRSLGCVTLHDYLGSLCSATSTTSKFSSSEIESALNELEKSEYDKRRADVEDCLQSAIAIDALLSGKIGLHRWSGARMIEVLTRVDQLLNRRAVETIALPMVNPSAASQLDSISCEQISTTEATPANLTANVVTSHEPNDLTSENQGTISRIMSRNDATHAIDSICSYFEENEPASPVPLLLQRAKRLIPMSFIEIIRELAPNESQQMLKQIMAPEKVAP